MKFTIENIEAYNKAREDFDNHWEGLFQSIAQAIVDHPTKFIYITHPDSVTDITVSVCGEGDEREVYISFRDQYGDREELVVSATALDHADGIAGYEVERAEAEANRKKEEQLRKEAERSEQARADMLAALGRNIHACGFTREELDAAVAKASAE